ncbi:unnamed protein product [Haemonchus placei]|uniref:Integrase catalytic domain-containing protein n=1 Tax=Haemonchus placei TaxID=6290 RepID=A0A0N4WL10_HAEPC|nr:unnamed protein product [Haemonchus placei]
MKLSALFENCREDDMSANLRGEEIALASKMLVRQHQLTNLTPDVVRMLHHLNLYNDEFGIWRCRGRLGNSALGDDAKFPMLILQKSWLSKLIINDYHSKGHPTINHTMALIRQHYWIPKLRSQVTVVIRRCVQCQRFNNLPFKYPEQSDLPSRRVLRSRPIDHVGLDYFGPLTIKREDGSTGKCYGCIITCLTTRLLHLDVASDLSTYAFIQMLRRFFARRGTPSTITSDNAPTFTLGDSVLQDCIKKVQNDPKIAKMVSNNEIRWKYITPFAPWQGGVYERLIRSVKLALFKFQGRSVPSHEELLTVLTEIQAMLNTRPLVYTESGPRENSTLRPIDFLQNNFEVPLYSNSSSEPSEDPAYLSAKERITLQSKAQVIEALKSSCEMPEKFWQTWQTEYLTSLRERHQREVGKQRGSSYVPKLGKVVLISDALQPRHSWKMGRIETLVSNPEGIVREAVVLLPSHRKIRRPLNLLVPLEIDEDFQNEVNTGKGPDDVETSEMRSKSKDNHTEEMGSRYNLRSKQRVNYAENFVGIARVRPHLTIALALSIFTILSAAVPDGRPTLTGETSANFVRSPTLGIEVPHSIETVRETKLELSIPRKFGGIRVFSHVTHQGRHERNNWKHGNNCMISTIEGVSIRVNKRAINIISMVPSLSFFKLQIFGHVTTPRNFSDPFSFCKKICREVKTIKFKTDSKILIKTSQKPTTRTLPLFRLASEEEEGDIKLLIDLTRKRVQDQKQIRTEIDMAAISLQRQKKIATTLVTQWNHHKNEDSFISASAAEQMRLTSQLLRQAEVTKERILRMGTRYLIMDLWHEDMTEWGDVSGYQRQVWLKRERDYAFGSRAIIELIKNQCEILNIAIEDMKAMLQRQEKELTESDRLTSFHVQGILKKEIESLQEHLNHRSDVDVLTKKVESQSLEIASIKSSLRTVEVVTAPTPIEQNEKSNQEVKLVELVEPEVREVEERENYEDLELVEEDDDDDDENHFKRMVNEVTDENVTGGNWSKDDEPASKSRRVEYYEPLINSRIRIVQAKLRRMEEKVKCYPYRDRRDESLGIPLDRNCVFCDAIGIHFSDACPQFRDGRTRYEIIIQKKWCIHCLEGPERHRYGYRFRKCWYCQRIKGTVFEDLCPNDNGYHHRAVCDVPDMKPIAQSRIEDTQRELFRLRNKMSGSHGGDHAEPGVTTTSRSTRYR